MSGCQIVEDGDRLTIVPGLGTRAAPLIACAILGGVQLWAIAQALAGPGANPAALAGRFADPDTMAKLEVVLPLALLGVSVWWFRAISHPIVLDKRANELSYTGRRESLVGARAVAVRLCDSSESTDHYEIEIVYGDRRVTVGVATWTCETVRERAEERAARIAAFLGLPVGAAPAA